MVESFVWSIGLTFEPQHANFRRVMTKVGSIITAIDDIYDIYGTPEELKLFTEVVERLVIKLFFDTHTFYECIYIKCLSSYIKLNIYSTVYLFCHIYRWDVNALDELPNYMKICFLALYNFVNEVSFDFLKENGSNIFLHLQKEVFIDWVNGQFHL